MKRSALALLAALVLSAAGTGARQQSKPQDPQRPPTFRTEANFVRVDVYPTANRAPVKDLKLEDFEVLEEGVPQHVSTFEYVQVRTGGPQDARLEPNTIQQSRDMMRDARARVFILFLDVPHVTIDGTWHSREPLVRMIDRVLGQDDLVGIMTPKMSPSDIMLARKTETIEASLRDRWPWGERHTLQEDEMDHLFEACFPFVELKGVVEEMKVRRRERMTLEALRELVVWLRDQREERKAVLTISEGWLLYRPNPELAEPRKINGKLEPMPAQEPIGVGPDGRLRVGDRDSFNLPGTLKDCWATRIDLAQMDNDRLLKDLMDDANRANASFYTVDPRGLPVFDYPIGPKKPPTLEVQRLHLQQRTDTLRVLADNTDGFAVMGSNDLDPGLRRIADDLSSYYLLGYYSANTKFDGRFRKITVRVKRPGVDVRARRGYKAATEAEVAATRTAAAPPVPEGVATTRELFGELARLRPEAKLHTQAIAVRTAATGPAEGAVTVWFAGELTRPVAAAVPAAITVGSGAETASLEVPLVAGQRSFTGSVTLKREPKDAVDVRVRIAPPGEIPFTDATRIDIATGLPRPLMHRRGPSTGNRYEPAGQPQFSRTERVRFDVPAGAAVAMGEVRILDRNATAVELPVTRSERDGWSSAEVTLAALGPGDYLVEITAAGAGGTQKVLAPFRVVR